jgi:protein SCO1/2
MSESDRRLHDQLLWGLLVAVGLAILGWAGWTWWTKPSASVPEAYSNQARDFLKGNALGDFHFIDEHGRTVTQEALQGKVWILNIFFTSCEMSCPSLIAAMAQLQRELRWSDGVLVSLSVDPDTDTPELLRAFASQCRADPERWRFLTGAKEEIFAFVHKAFAAPLSENPEERPGYRITHSNRFLLVDRQGKVYGSYLVVEPATDPEGKPVGTFRVEETELERLRRDAERLAQDTSR